MKSRFHLVALALCIGAAFGTPVAQASSSNQSTLGVMLKAGVNYHASANAKNEKNLVGSTRSSAQSGARPDDRGGRRGI